LEAILEALYEYIIQSNAQTHSDEKLMHKIINRGRKNMNEWFKRIVKDYIEDQAVKDGESI
jgi:hypothetical protein